MPPVAAEPKKPQPAEQVEGADCISGIGCNIASTRCGLLAVLIASGLLAVLTASGLFVCFAQRAPSPGGSALERHLFPTARADEDGGGGHASRALAAR
eukprot:6421173-Prymnesium_polylepis.2